MRSHIVPAICTTNVLEVGGWNQVLVWYPLNYENTLPVDLNAMPHKLYETMLLSCQATPPSTVANYLVMFFMTSSPP